MAKITTIDLPAIIPDKKLRPKKCRRTSFNTLAQLSIRHQVASNQSFELIFDYSQKSRECAVCRIKYATKEKIPYPPFWKWINFDKRAVIWLVKRSHWKGADLFDLQDCRLTPDIMAGEYLADTFYHNTTDGHIYTSDKKFENDSKEKLHKKAKAKFFTNHLASALYELDTPLQKSYISSLECCSILVQNNDKLTGKYCKQRWCTVCNRIRTAKMINGYVPNLKHFPDPQFVTLTVPNVKGYLLPTMLTGMQNVWRNIYRSYRMVGMKDHKPVGIKKLECTYNATEDTYHPHYHFIVDGELQADLLRWYWMKQWESMGTFLSRKAQHIKPVEDEGGFVELFKYFTKLVTKVEVEDNKDLNFFGGGIANAAIYIHSLDVIFSSMYKRRTFEPFGVTAVSEDIDELAAEKYEHLAYASKNWQWIESDWVCDGEGISGYVPKKKMIALVNSIVH